MRFDASSVPKLEMRIPHRNWVNALSEAFALLSVADPGDVISITGPSRAGKSRLISELKRLLVGSENLQETGRMPVVVVEAVNGGVNGTFSTKWFIQRMLDAVEHPILSFSGKVGPTEKLDRSTEAGLRRALEKAFKNRGTRYLFIDEAQHARYASRSSQAPCAVMDSWKCLAQNAGLVLVVVGAYPILGILQNSPHLLGRKQQVHLPRYGLGKDDLREFVKIIKAYEKALQPLLKEEGLSDHLLFLHHGTCGCIGLLKKWLKSAATLACVYDRALDVSILEKTRPSDADLSEISREIIDGESLIFASPHNEGRTAFPMVSCSEKAGGAKVKATPGRKPFTRNPKRNKSGNRLSGGGVPYE